MNTTHHRAKRVPERIFAVAMVIGLLVLTVFISKRAGNGVVASGAGLATAADSATAGGASSRTRPDDSRAVATTDVAATINALAARNNRAVSHSEERGTGGAGRKAQGGAVEFRTTLRVFIHPDDIYPRLVRVRPGKVVISAENNTQKDIAIIIEPASTPGHNLGRVAAAVRDKRNKHEYTLGAGEYVFYEETQPKRQGKLIVDPKLR